MEKNVDVIICGICFYFTFLGSVAATLNLPCRVNKETSWDKGYHFNCSYRQLTQVPLDIPVGTTTLLLNNNVISKLGSTAFSNLTELRYLDLSRNMLRSTQIALDAFSALGSLQYLDLRYNSLCMSNECFPERLYRSLHSLKVYKVTGNTKSDERGVCDYPFRSLSVLQALTELHISAISNVHIPSEISRFKNLRILNLHDGYMPNISVATFRTLQHTNITTLSLRNTQIRNVEFGSFSNLPNLRQLNMACNSGIGYKRLIRVLWTMTNSGIDSLVMDNVHHNGFGNILNFKEVCTTKFAKRIKQLSLQENNIITVDTKYFGQCLPSIQWLNLGFNNIVFFNRHGIERSQVLRTFPPQMIVLDISHHFNLPDEFRKQYCSVDNLPFDHGFRRPVSFTFDVGTSERNENATLMQRDELYYVPPSLKYIYADHMLISSGIDVTSPYMLYPTSNVIYINISNTKAIKSLLAPLKGLEKLEILDMSHGILQHIAADFFTNFDNLRFVNFSDNKLGESLDRQSQIQTASIYSHVFNNLISLQELDLSQNLFHTINQDAFVNLTELRVLRLDNNLFKKQLSLNLSRLTSLQSLNLSTNQMSSLSEDFCDALDELSKRVNFSVDISGNPLSCRSCASFAFLRWLRKTNVRVVAKDKLTCAENHDLRVVNVSLEDLKMACATVTPGVSLLIVLTVAGSIGFATLTTLLFLYVHRWRIRWYYYSIKRRWQNDTSTHDAGHYRYDACVVYANADLDWVAHELIDQVETDWALSLFVYDRDSMAGCPIAENIVQSLETSKHVLFVLTPDFCREKWCDFALNMALLRDQKSLVILYIKPIAHDSMSRTLRALVNPRTRCTLVEWGDGEYAQSLFWQSFHDTLLPTTDSDMLLYRFAPCLHRPLLPSD